MGMPHRGRLNVLANILDKPYGLIFGEFEGNAPRDRRRRRRRQVPPGLLGRPRHGRQAIKVHISLTPNPSHLEAVNPVVEGRVRAKQKRFKDTERKLGLPVLIHGDAAFAGQGLVAETLNLSQLTGYKTGGTIHIVVNNQIGFTTNPADSRSSRYCTDVAKMIEVPIFHVNGEDPEAVVYVAELAIDFRQDVRPGRRHRHGLLPPPRPQRGRRAGVHPAGHVPPRSRIRKTGSASLYTDAPDRAPGTSVPDEADDDRRDVLRQDEERLPGGPRRPATPESVPCQPGFTGPLERYSSRPTRSNPVETGVPAETLKKIAGPSNRGSPTNFTVNPEARPHPERPVKKMDDGRRADRLVGRRDALAFGSLLLEGIARPAERARTAVAAPSASGTPCSSTSETGEPYIPLNHLGMTARPRLSVYDSLLSEAAVLGFDYGYSLEEPNMLIDVGGPVRRLRQRRPGDRRPVHRLGRERSGAAPAAW